MHYEHRCERCDYVWASLLEHRTICTRCKDRGLRASKRETLESRPSNAGHGAGPRVVVQTPLFDGPHEWTIGYYDTTGTWREIPGRFDSPEAAARVLEVRAVAHPLPAASREP